MKVAPAGAGVPVVEAGRPRRRPSGALPVTAVVLTRDEELNLPDCLASVAGWVAEIVVVDSGSTDRTLAIARSHGARVLHHPFESHARQWEWVLGQVALGTDWVLGLDADQRVTPELRANLARAFEAPDGLEDVAGFYIARRQIFRGRWIRFGGYYPKYLLKLFRRDRVSFDRMDLVDHHFHVRGETRLLRGDLIEDNQKERDLAFWMEKHVRYARLHAREELVRRSGVGWPIPPRLFGTPDERVVWLKRLWTRLPLFFRPALYFFYRYFIRLGILDGREGFIFHFMQAFWYRLLVDVLIRDMRAAGHAAPPPPLA